MNMSLTKAIQDYIDKNPYLTNNEMEEARMYNDAGEWAVALEYVCARLIAYIAMNHHPLSSKEIEELESLVNTTKEMEYEYFNDIFLNNVKKASYIHSSRDFDRSSS